MRRHFLGPIHQKYEEIQKRDGGARNGNSVFIYCVALLTCSNLDESTQMNMESVAKNNSGDDQMDPAILEHTMKRFTASSEQTTGDIMYIRESNRSREGGNSRERESQQKHP